MSDVACRGRFENERQGYQAVLTTNDTDVVEIAVKFERLYFTIVHGTCAARPCGSVCDFSSALGSQVEHSSYLQCDLTDRQGFSVA